MKVALIASLYRPIKKDALAGTEIWTYNFAEELIRQGVDVTLYADSESEFSGKIKKISDANEVLNQSGEISREKNIFCSMEEMRQIVEDQNEYDLIHIAAYGFYYYLPLTKLLNKPCVYTFQGNYQNIDRKFMERVFKDYSQVNFVYISQAMKEKWPEPKRHEIIHNGIELKDFPFNDKKEDFYFWMGRIVPDKGTEDAILFALKTNSRLIIAGPVDNHEYFNGKVKPFLNDKIQYVGELNLAEKWKYYSNAKAFLMTIKWEEAFGLVTVEANACGTPVIAYKRGALKEIVKDGVNGFLIKPDSIDGLVEASEKIDKVSPKNCRQEVENHYTVEKMTKKYIDCYEKMK